MQFFCLHLGTFRGSLNDEAMPHGCSHDIDLDFMALGHGVDLISLYHTRYLVTVSHEMSCHVPWQPMTLFLIPRSTRIRKLWARAVVRTNECHAITQARDAMEAGGQLKDAARHTGELEAG